jgi:hypothetical protein
MLNDIIRCYFYSRALLLVTIAVAQFVPTEMMSTAQKRGRGGERLTPTPIASIKNNDR